MADIDTALNNVRRFLSGGEFLPADRTVCVMVEGDEPENDDPSPLTIGDLRTIAAEPSRKAAVSYWRDQTTQAEAERDRLSERLEELECELNLTMAAISDMGPDAKAKFEAILYRARAALGAGR